MHVNENWAIDICRMRAFLREQPDVLEDGGCFHYRDCTITLHAQQAQLMGKWALPRTQITLDGSDADVKAIQRRIFMRFLSAGG